MADRSVIDLLCRAAATGDLQGVNNLLQSGANVNGFNGFNRTALQVGGDIIQICVNFPLKRIVFIKFVYGNLCIL